MNAPRVEEKNVNKLSDSDEWFLNYLRAIVSDEELMVKRGLQSHVNRSGISDWITRHTDTSYPHTLSTEEKNK